MCFFVAGCSCFVPCVQVDYSFTVQAFMSEGKDEMGLATLVQAYKVKEIVLIEQSLQNFVPSCPVSSRFVPLKTSFDVITIFGMA